MFQKFTTLVYTSNLYSFQIIRDSPDGKPTSHEDDVPLGVSTPLDGSSTDLNTRRPFQCQLTNTSQSPMNENSGSKDSLGVDASGVSNSWNSTNDGRSCSDSSTSFASPNLIRPFEVDSDSRLSPNLLHPFEGNRKANVTFTKESRGMKELEEYSSKGNAAASRSFDGRELEMNAQSLGNETSGEDCKRNLAGDFSVVANPDLTARLSSSQYSSDTNNNSSQNNNNNNSSSSSNNNDPLPAVPLSPQVPQRFIEFPGATDRRNNATAELIFKTDSQEFQESQAACNGVSSDHDGGSGKTSKEKSIFLFDSLDIERCNSRRSNYLSGCQRLACSPCDRDSALEGYDSDYRSSPSIVNSYIEGVSLNSK